MVTAEEALRIWGAKKPSEEHGVEIDPMTVDVFFSGVTNPLDYPRYDTDECWCPEETIDIVATVVSKRYHKEIPLAWITPTLM